MSPESFSSCRTSHDVRIGGKASSAKEPGSKKLDVLVRNSCNICPLASIWKDQCPSRRIDDIVVFAQETSSSCATSTAVWPPTNPLQWHPAQQGMASVHSNATRHHDQQHADVTKRCPNSNPLPACRRARNPASDLQPLWPFQSPGYAALKSAEEDHQVLPALDANLLWILILDPSGSSKQSHRQPRRTIEASIEEMGRPCLGNLELACRNHLWSEPENEGVPSRTYWVAERGVRRARGRSAPAEKGGASPARGGRRIPRRLERRTKGSGDAIRHSPSIRSWSPHLLHMPPNNSIRKTIQPSTRLIVITLLVLNLYQEVPHFGYSELHCQFVTTE
jgi:hypothetical protein